MRIAEVVYLSGLFISGNWKGGFVSDFDGSERIFEKLSKAVTEAVMASPKVKKIVSEIQKNDHICPKSFMVLVLKMEVLTDSLELEVEEETTEERPAPKKGKSKKSAQRPQFIDGQELSKKEIKFQEFANKKFDTQEWLNKNGLIF